MMVVHFRRKSRHRRGTSRGVGIRSKRGAGNRGGRGRAGLGKRAGHRKFMFINSDKYIGKHGFTSVKQKNNFHLPAVNVGEIDKLAEKLGQHTKDGFEIDLTKLGYGKVIGSGQVKNKLIVHVSKFSPSAKEKIEAAGGKLISEQSEKSGEE